MYDQGQYSNNLYHQLDDEKVPIIIRNQPPLLFRVHREADWNPYTQLQIEHSEWTHEPQEKLWSQESLNIQLEPKRVVYPPFMIERPYYIEPVTERASLMYMGGLDPAAQGGKSLYSKDLGQSAAIRASAKYVNRALVQTVRTDSVTGWRVQDFVFGITSMVDYNPDDNLALYSKYRHTSVTAAAFKEVIAKLGLQGNLLKLLHETTNGQVLSQLNEGGIARRGQMTQLGERMMSNAFLNELQGNGRQNLFYFWIFMPHASAGGDSDTKYDSVMYMISHFVLTGRWVNPSEFKEGEGYVSSYVGGQNQVVSGVSNTFGSIVAQVTGSSALGGEAARYAQAYLTQGADAANATLANYTDNVKTQVQNLGQMIVNLYNATGSK
jgi:hypothetical protein